MHSRIVPPLAADTALEMGMEIYSAAQMVIAATVAGAAGGIAAAWFAIRSVAIVIAIAKKEPNPLIDSAPELLEALDWCVAETNRESPSVINARAVIARAKGGAA